MIYANEPRYNLEKPPIILVARQERFVCIVCTKPGWGPPGTKCHGGKCHKKHVAELAKRNTEKRRLKKQKLAAAPTETAA